MLGQKQNVQSLHSTVLPEEELDSYRSEFDLALSDPDITNIAISGPFGVPILIAGATVIDEMVTHGIHNGARDGVSWMFGIAREI